MKPIATFKTACIKCGSDKHSLKHWDGKYPVSRFVGLYASFKEARKEYEKMKATAHERECIEVICSDCGYTWNIETLDKSNEQKTEEVLYGGARGGSMKSSMLIDWAVQTIREDPFTVETITTKDVKPVS